MITTRRRPAEHRHQIELARRGLLDIRNSDDDEIRLAFRIRDLLAGGGRKPSDLILSALEAIQRVGERARTRLAEQAPAPLSMPGDSRAAAAVLLVLHARDLIGDLSRDCLRHRARALVQAQAASCFCTVLEAIEAPLALAAEVPLCVDAPVLEILAALSTLAARAQRARQAQLGHALPSKGGSDR